MTQAARAEQPPKNAAPPAPRAKKPTLQVGGKPLAIAADPAPAAPIARIVPSAPQLFPLIRLLRAPENVRHVRVDEDVQPLADDIAAHGLLQSLIGYLREGDPASAKVMIVGGGRRFQALMKLWEAGLIDGRTFTVPVLIRGVDEAIELSLAENLQQRTMSPVDEFHAFKALMDRGDTSPRQLAARFGFSETVVKQRLRLADLVPEVLDALAERKISIDAATAYATTQDRDLQLAVFKVQDRKGWDPHRPANIRSDVGLKGMRTTDAVFRFIGQAAYEAEGGGYEDDLFADGADANREGRVLDKPFLARAIGERMIGEHAPVLLDKLRADKRLSPTIVGHVAPASLRLHGGRSHPYVAHDDKLKLPAGFVDLDRRYRDEAVTWKAVRARQTEVHVIVGLDQDGELQHIKTRLLVPKAEKPKLEGAEQAARLPEPTPEEREAQARQAQTLLWARRLAIGPWTGTPLDGRAFWPNNTHWEKPERVTRAGVTGYSVPVRIFVDDAAIDAAMPAAEVRVDEEAAIAAALARKVDEIEALDAVPAVIEIDGRPVFHWQDDSWRPAEEPADPADAAPIGAVAWRTYGLLKDARAVGQHWPTIDAYHADRGEHPGAEA